MPGQLKRGKGPYQAGGADKSGAFEFYPIPQATSIPKSQTNTTSWWKSETILAASTSSNWLIYSSRSFKTPIIIDQIYIQCTRTNTAGAYQPISKLMYDIFFPSGNTSTFSALPVTGGNTEIFNRLSFQSPGDNTVGIWDGPFNIYANVPVTATMTAYGSFALNDILYWSIQWKWHSMM